MIASAHSNLLTIECRPGERTFGDTKIAADSMLVTVVMDIEQCLEARRQALINRRLTQLPVAMPLPQEWRRASVRNMTENSRCLAVAGRRWEI